MTCVLALWKGLTTPSKPQRKLSEILKAPSCMCLRACQHSARAFATFLTWFGVQEFRTKEGLGVHGEAQRLRERVSVCVYVCERESFIRNYP